MVISTDCERLLSLSGMDGMSGSAMTKMKTVQTSGMDFDGEDEKGL